MLMQQLTLFSGALEVMIQLMSQNGVQKPNLHIRRASLFTEFYDTARPEPQYSSEVTDIMGDTLQSVMFGGSSGADAAQLAQEQIEALN